MMKRWIIKNVAAVVVKKTSLVAAAQMTSMKVVKTPPRPRSMRISGDTLCRDNCQLIGMPFFHTRSAGKNNRN